MAIYHIDRTGIYRSTVGGSFHRLTREEFADLQDFVDNGENEDMDDAFLNPEEYEDYEGEGEPDELALDYLYTWQRNPHTLWEISAFDSEQEDEWWASREPPDYSRQRELIDKFPYRRICRFPAACDYQIDVIDQLRRLELDDTSIGQLFPVCDYAQLGINPDLLTPEQLQARGNVTPLSPYTVLRFLTCATHDEARLLHIAGNESYRHGPMQDLERSLFDAARTGDMTARAVYADWLEEQNRTVRAALLRFMWQNEPFDFSALG